MSGTGTCQGYPEGSLRVHDCARAGRKGAMDPRRTTMKVSIQATASHFSKRLCHIFGFSFSPISRGPGLSLFVLTERSSLNSEVTTTGHNRKSSACHKRACTKCGQSGHIPLPRHCAFFLRYQGAIVPGGHPRCRPRSKVEILGWGGGDVLAGQRPKVGRGRRAFKVHLRKAPSGRPTPGSKGLTAKVMRRDRMNHWGRQLNCPATHLLSSSAKVFCPMP
jgi:hypothetical protein